MDNKHYLLNIEYDKGSNKMLFFTRNQDGQPHSFAVPHNPDFYVSVAENNAQAQALFEKILAYAQNQKVRILSKKLTTRKIFAPHSQETGKEQQTKVYHLVFDTNAGMQKILKQCAKDEYRDKLTTYTSKLSQEIHYMCDNKYQSNGWVRIVGQLGQPPKLEFLDDVVLPPKYVALSFDIETTSSTGKFPNAQTLGDRIIQIGMVFSSGEKYLLNLGPNSPSKDYQMITFCKYLDYNKNEIELIYAFFDLIKKHKPDIVTGYNIFGFDEKYIFERAELLLAKLEEDKSGKDYMYDKKHYKMSNAPHKQIEFKELAQKCLQSSGLGKNEMCYIKSLGITHVDLMQVIRQKYNFESYSLDSVCQELKKLEITSIKRIDAGFIAITTKTSDPFAKPGRFVILKCDRDFDSITSKKIKIVDVDPQQRQIVLEDSEIKETDGYNRFSLVKDDVDIKESFELWNEENTPFEFEKKKVIADYCIQDCELVLSLAQELNIFEEGFEMARVCNVPFNFIYSRGQGIRILSLIHRDAIAQNFLIPDRHQEVDECEYLGAFVYDPVAQYRQQPTIVLDFESLYPNCMIDKNMSNETCVKESACNFKELLESGKLNAITVDLDTEGKPIADPKTYYFMKPEVQPGLIPEILKMLIRTRKEVKGKMDREKDPLKKMVFNIQQLAVKVIANSIYGQTGAKTSQLFCLDIAESTTAYGRQNIQRGINYVNKHLRAEIRDIAQNGADALNQLEQQDILFLQQLVATYDFQPLIVYGDTDSVFINMQFTLATDSGKEPVVSVPRKKLVGECIQLGGIIEKLIKKNYSKQLNLRYEKCLVNMCLFKKKRYVGWVFENSADKKKFYMTGIVLKRRDNSRIVKKVYRQLLRQVLEDENIYFGEKQQLVGQSIAQDFVDQIKRILCGKEDIGLFVTSRRLNDDYVNRERIAHAVLCDREERASGKKLQVGDRIQFVYVYDELVNMQKNSLLGEKIEFFDKVVANPEKYKIDYIYYIANQIMMPCKQLLELLLPEKMYLAVVEEVEGIIDAEIAERDSHFVSVLEKLVATYFEQSSDEKRQILLKILNFAKPKKTANDFESREQFESESAYLEYLQAEMQKKNTKQKTFSNLGDFKKHVAKSRKTVKKQVFPAVISSEAEWLQTMEEYNQSAIKFRSIEQFRAFVDKEMRSKRMNFAEEEAEIYENISGVKNAGDDALNRIFADKMPTMIYKYLGNNGAEVIRRLCGRAIGEMFAEVKHLFVAAKKTKKKITGEVALTPAIAKKMITSGEFEDKSMVGVVTHYLSCLSNFEPILSEESDVEQQTVA